MLRNNYQELVQWAKKSSKPLILLGARQVGKTHLIKQFAQNEFKQSLYLNFEETSEIKKYFEQTLSPKKIIDSLEIFLDQKITPQTLIIFDEIQECPRALTSLKYFAEDKTYQVISAGSLLGLSLSDASFPVGKVEFSYLGPLTFVEFLRALNPLIYEKYQQTKVSDFSLALHEKLLNIYLQYLFVGGMPEVVAEYIKTHDGALDHFNQTRAIQKNILKSYMSDFSKHAGKNNSLHLSSLWTECANQLGQSHDETTKRFRFQGALPGKKQFSQFESLFHWLDAASLILKSHIINLPEIPLDSFCKKSLFKTFYFDVGLLNATLNISIASILEQNLKTYKGFMAENFVAQELRALGHQKLYTWEGAQSEIEFLVTIDSDIIPIEVKSGKRTKAKSLGVYDSQYAPKKKIIFSMAPYKQSGTLFKVPLYAIEKII
jgi:predicted AAA+ superfamily ATPase